MKLHRKLDIPMGCPYSGCDGEDFDIIKSHPFGTTSQVMSVSCEKCGRQFYTDKGVYAASIRPLAEKLTSLINIIAARAVKGVRYDSQ